MKGRIGVSAVALVVALGVVAVALGWARTAGATKCDFDNWNRAQLSRSEVLIDGREAGPDSEEALRWADTGGFEYFLSDDGDTFRLDALASGDGLTLTPVDP